MAGTCREVSKCIRWHLVASGSQMGSNLTRGVSDNTATVFSGDNYAKRSS